MLYRFFGILMVLLPLFPLRVEAQTRDYKITHIGTQDGLSQGSVYAVMRDSRGVMWFGSQDGLNSMKDNRITCYFPKKNSSTSISGSKINSIQEDGDGNIWIGTENGLNVYNYRSASFRAYLKNQEVSILAILKNDIYLWSSKDGFIKFDRVRYTFEFFFEDNHFDSNYTNTLNSSLIISPEEFWIHQNDAIVHVSNQKKTYYFSDHPENIAGEKQLITKVLLRDKKLYLATENGLEILDTNNSKVASLRELHGIPLGLILDFVFDQNGDMWLCLEGNGLLYYSPKTNQFHHFKKKSDYRSGIWDNLTSHVYVDWANVVWVNTDPFGVDKIEVLKGNFKHVLLDYPVDFDENKKNQSVRSFCEDDTNIWVGTLNSGIWLLDKESMEVTGSFVDDELPSNRIFHMLRHTNGELFAATSAGLASIKNGRVSQIPLPRYEKKITGTLVRSLELFEKTLYISTEEGIVKYDVEKKAISDTRLFPTKKMELTYHLTKDTFLSGFISGGLWLVKNDRKLKEILQAEIPLFVLPKSRSPEELWVGTSGGLFLINAAGETLKHYTTDDGLPNNYIYQGIQDAESNLWVSTNRGIACLVHKDNKFYSFNLNDGLQDYEYNAFASFKDSYGRLYFGGVNGFNYFTPEDIILPAKSVKNILRPDITSLTVTDFRGFLEDTVGFARPQLNTAKFTSLFTGTFPNYLYTVRNGWVHFKVQNDSRDKWYLEVQNTRLNELELWIFEKGREVYYQKLGDELPFDFYPLRDPNPTFELDLLENQQYDFYIKARTTRDFKLPVQFFSESALLEHQSNRKLVWGIFVGFILLISFYNVFLWLTIKDKTYLYYTLYILSFGLFQFSIYGFAYQYFWSNHPVNEYAFLCFLSAAYIFVTLFTGSFLALSTRLKHWQIIKKILIISNLAFILLLPICYRNEFNYFAIGVSLFLSILFYIICYKLWNSEDRIIRYYALAVFFLSTSSIVLAFQNLGFISSANQEYVLMVGSMFEIVLFSLALGYKFRRNVLEKERQQRLRNEISSNLHDDLAASLSSLTMYAELSKKKQLKSDPELNERFTVISQKARGILAKVRTAVYELDPRYDTDDDWLYYIINFGKEIFESSETDFKAEVAIDFQSEKLKIGYRREMIYLFKEAMNNAAKYANATDVVFTARYTANKIILSLKDDGVGMQRNAIQNGKGINNMAARAKSCHAQINVMTSPGQGCSIEVLLNTY